MADAYGLRIGAPSPWNSQTRIAFSFVNFALDATNDGVAAIHQAVTAEAITQIGFRYGARTGTPPTYRASLQALDASGNPDGTVLGGGSPASVTFTPPADATWDGTWQIVTLDNSYTPTQGQVFAIVIEYSAGTVNGSNFGSFTSNHSNGTITVNLPVNLTLTAGSWGNKNARVPVLSYYTATACYGFPSETLFDSGSYSSASTPDEYALAFALPAAWGDTYVLRGFSVYMRGTASGTFEAVLYSGTTALQTVTMDADAPSTTVGALDVLFPAAETLSYGSTYRVSIKPTSGSSGLWAAIGCETATEAAAFSGGSAFWQSSRADAGAWSDDTTKRPFAELILADITEPSGGGGTHAATFIG